MKQERTRMMLAMVEPSEAQRLVLRIYFNHSNEAELCACCASGSQLLAELRRGLRPEAIILDVACDNVLTLVREVRRAVAGYTPMVALTIHSNTLLSEKILLTSGVDCVILKPYEIPDMLATVFQHSRQDEAFQEFMRRRAFEKCLGDYGAAPDHMGSRYLSEMFCEEERAGTSCTSKALYHCVARKENLTASGVRNAVRRLAEQMWRTSTPGYCRMCAAYGKSMEAPLSERELYCCLAEECRRGMR